MKRRVAAGVIAMEMGIDHIFDRQRRELLDRGLDLVVERRELGVHHDDAVGAHRDGDVAALAREHVSLVAEIDGVDLDFGKIDRLLGIGDTGKKHGTACQGRDGYPLHVSILLLTTVANQFVVRRTSGQLRTGSAFRILLN
jgi:hypothetical protein